MSITPISKCFPLTQNNKLYSVNEGRLDVDEIIQISGNIKINFSTNLKNCFKGSVANVSYIIQISKLGTALKHAEFNECGYLAMGGAR